MKKLRTCDLYYGAYLLSKGSKLDRVDMPDYGKRRIFFEFTGEDLKQLALEYVGGRALVNVRDLKASLEHLKDIIYENISEKIPS